MTQIHAEGESVRGGGGGGEKVLLDEHSLLVSPVPSAANGIDADQGFFGP